MHVICLFKDIHACMSSVAAHDVMTLYTID